MSGRLAKLALLLLLLLAAGGTARAQGTPAPRSGDAGVLFLGRQNWEQPWVPDLEHEGARLPLGEDKRLDVVILGDGYLSRERRKFEADARDWYADFTALTPWKQYRGVFRVRALWTPSAARATPEKRSYYQMASTRADTGYMFARTTRERIFDSLYRAGIRASDPAEFYRRTTVVLLIRTTDYYKPSGHSRVLADPAEKLRVHVAFGNYSHHEFGHARVGLQDEYIGRPGVASRAARPGRVTLFGNSNLSYTRDPGRIPWRHLLPGSEVNPDKDSLIGLLWIGGNYEHRAWHSEPYCLMNGASSNWNLSRTARGADLRTRGRFCFWCEELATATLWALTGQLGDDMRSGAELWRRWGEKGRPLYWKAFQVAERIQKRNADYEARHLETAKIYERPRADGTEPPDPGGIEPEEDPD